MQKTLVTIIGEHQSEAIKNITLLYTFPTICVITDESNKLSKSISVISLELILSFLLSITLDMETNSFAFKLHIPTTNLKLEYMASYLIF